MMRPSFRHLVSLCLALFFGSALLGRAQAPDSTQTLVLPSGWSLISVQVGNAPLPVAKFRNAFSDPNQVAEIWGYDPSGAANAPGSWDFNKLPPLPGLTSDLPEIEQGKGYWIRIANGTATATLTGPVWSGTVTIEPGWSLVGFPGLAFGANEQQVLSDVFGSHFDRIQQVWTFDSAAQRFIGYDDSAIPRLTDLTTVEAGEGYWVYSIDSAPLDLAPVPFIALPPDADASPPEPLVDVNGTQVRYVNPDGTDDRYDYNSNGIIDDAESQDAILFERTAGTSTITIGNKGSGVLTWTLENDVPWLFTVPPDEKEFENNEGRPKTASGTVSSENDLLILYADRRGQSPGTLGPETITLWVGDEPKVITIYAEVADISGDWSGSATTRRVNGQDVSLGEVRLALNAFLRGDDEGDMNGTQDEKDGIRAVMDREKAILFPRDVFLEGVFYSEKDFQLTTNFEMPAGDRNAPPFATFPGDPDDRDFNGDGRVDVMNPFPYGIRREVTLLGTRVSPDRLEGTYVESIRGMLPPLTNNTLTNTDAEFVSEEFLTTSQAIVIEGDFVLERDSFEPTKRSVFNETMVVNAPLGGTDVQVRTQTLEVATSFTVQGVTLALDLEFPDPALMRILLTAPEGTIHIVHDFGDATLPDPSTLLPEEVFQGSQGFGTWTLQAFWDTTERGTWNSWGLNLEGVSTHRVTGQVVSGGLPLTNVTLRLEGSVQPRPVASADGSFDIAGLTENDYTLFVTKSGYEEKTVTFFVGEDDVALGDIELTPLSVTEPELRAAPPIGFQKLTTVLTVLKPLSTEVDEIEWDFGDGTTVSGPLEGGPLGDLSVIAHTYEEAGLFTVTVMLKNLGAQVGDSLTTEITSLRSRADGDLAQGQIVLAGFVGALGARTDGDADLPGEPPVEVTTVSEPAEISTLDSMGDPVMTSFSTTSAEVFQESKWDVATFDLDRVPIRLADSPFSSAEEDTDFAGQSYVSYNAVSQQYERRDGDPARDPAFDFLTGTYSSYEIPEGATKPTRFRMAVTLGGAVFSPQPQSFGGLTIHPGRTIRPPQN